MEQTINNRTRTAVIAGGGAAGFFAALRLAELLPDSARIIILEKSDKVLSKVKVSGGGRCNVTHACFEPRVLASHYPRGAKELIGPFHRFGPAQLIDWFEVRGVALKTETDGRMFPVTNSSQTVIDCFLRESQARGIEIRKQCGLQTMNYADGQWQLQLSDGSALCADAVLVSTGSSSLMWKELVRLGHAIIEPVPSLFTFNLQDDIVQLSGVSLPEVKVQILDAPMSTTGPLLITHWGLSGPAVLKLSAWGARHMYSVNYRFSVKVNWLNRPALWVENELMNQRKVTPQKQAGASAWQELPRSLWQWMVQRSGINLQKRWADVSNREIRALAQTIAATEFQVEGKSTFKEEFVTAGGVSLAEVNFKTMQSRLWPQLYFAGEVLDVDAVTGGFNFQAAWTTAYIAATHMASGFAP